MSWNSPRLARRTFIRSALGATPFVLAACAPAAPAAPTPRPAAPSGTAASGGFPTYQAAATRPTPDFPSAGSLYEDGYNNYPSNLVRSVSRPPGAGGSVTAFV